MLTWSSRLADEGMLSTTAGWHSTLFSLTSAAAVTCTIMKPELRPGCGAKNGGRPDDNEGFRSCSMRRSERLASSAAAMARRSSAMATG